MGSAAFKGATNLIKKGATTATPTIDGTPLTKLSTESTEEAVSEVQEKAIQKTSKRNAKQALDTIAVDQELIEKYSAPYSEYHSRWNQTPKDGGYWSGIRGESDFILNIPIQLSDGTEITKVTYKNAIPDFSPYQEAKVKIEGMTNNRKSGIINNFSKGDTELARIWNEKAYQGKTNWSASDIRKYRELNNLTWHEMNNMEYMQLVPTEVNAKFRHLGGVGEYNAMINQSGGDDFD